MLLGVRSNVRPTAAGDHRFFASPICVLPAAPWTCSMQASRVRPAAAVFASAVRAGTIASRNGSAIVAPMPRRTVRRLTCFFVRYISPLLSVRTGVRAAHAERRALHDPEDERRKVILVRAGVADDAAYRGHVVTVEAAAEGLRHQVVGDSDEHGLLVFQQRGPQSDRAADRRAVVELARRVDVGAAVADAPLADDVEILQRQAERIDHAMARAALGARTVL